MTATSAAILLGVILLPKDIEVGINTVIGDGLAPEQFMKILPLSLKTIIGILTVSDDVDKLVDDLKTSLHF